MTPHDAASAMDDGAAGRRAGDVLRRPLRRFARQVLSRLVVGRLVVRLPDGECLARTGPQPGPAAQIHVHRWRAVRRTLWNGSIGLAESYIDGDWSSPSLSALLELGARNDVALSAALSGSAFARSVQQLRHRLRANTKRGSRRNIMAHYDLGNAFYAKWLDAGMTYSSAVFTRPDQTLEAAQLAKQERVMDLLSAAGGSRVLEIGCGWGGLAERMTQRNCHVTGLTLSPAQLSYTSHRLRHATRAGLADLRLQDYRDVTGLFDRIVAIEMLEAVGREYWPAFFETIKNRLAPDGVAVLQVISIDDAQFDGYVREADFIQRHVFPGGMLPSPSIMREQIASAGLHLDVVERFGDSYARTLAAWQTRFQDAWPSIAAMGFDLDFKRLWEYYLSYCEAGFRAGTLDVALYRITHARS